MIGESLPPPLGQRLLPELCLLLAAAFGVASLTLLMATPSRYGVPAGLALAAAGLIGYALRLEAHLGRRRFVLHFSTETLRLDRLAWAPSATRTETVPFDDVTAVEVVQRPSGHFAIIVTWKADKRERRAALVEQVRPSEVETLRRVWRMLHNAFGLKASGPAGA